MHDTRTAGDRPSSDAAVPGDGLRSRTALGLLAFAVSALVAVAAAGFGLVTSPLESGSGWLGPVRLAGAAVAAVGVAGLLRHRRSVPRDRAHGADPTVAALSAAALILTAVAVMAAVIATAELLGVVARANTPTAHDAAADVRRAAAATLLGTAAFGAVGVVARIGHAGGLLPVAVAAGACLALALLLTREGEGDASTT